MNTAFLCLDDACLTPGKCSEDWQLDDPGKGIDAVRHHQRRHQTRAEKLLAELPQA